MTIAITDADAPIATDSATIPVNTGKILNEST